MRKIRLCLLSALAVFALVAPVAMYVQPVWAPLTCPSVVVGPGFYTVLSSSFAGNCITVLPTAAGSTIAFTGATISCLSTPGSVGVLNFASTVTITGPGFVSSCETGIALLGPGACTVTTGNTVSNMGIISNLAVGIHIACSNSNTINGNAISSNGGLGVFIDNGAGNTIKNNQINQHFGSPGTSSSLGGGAGVEIHIGPSSVLKENSIFGNTNGVYMDGFSGGSTIKANLIIDNGSPCFGFGGVLHPSCGYGFITSSGGNTIKNNTVSFNARDGINVAGSSNIIKANTVNGNGLRGIVLGNSCAGALPGSPGTGFPAGSGNLVIGNTALTNGLVIGSNIDFYWDGIGAGNTWIANTADLGSAIPFVDGPATQFICPG